MKPTDAYYRFAALLCAFALAAPAEAFAQEAPSIAALFRSYSEAVSRGDLVAAEGAAEAALAASEQRDGGAGHTAVLAYNLSRTRVLLGQWEEARVPAERAYELTRANPNTGVDPLLSRLLLGRIRLSFEGLDGVSFLRAALEDASSRADLLEDRYAAAEQLAVWASDAHRYDWARAAWDMTAAAADGAGVDASFARGRAKVYEGIAIAMQALTREVVLPRRVAREVRERFAEAHPLLQPFAARDGAQGQFTAPQTLYAQMLAWDAAIWSKMVSDDPSLRGRQRLAPNPTTIDNDPMCLAQVRRSGLSYPVQSGFEGQLGAVVVRLRFGSTGELLASDVIASVGDERFSQAVARVTWAATIDVSQSGCRPPTIIFWPITFYEGY